MAFVHLHTHSEYSLLDGSNRIPELVGHVQKLGMDSLAVTDHGNLHAAWSFYAEASFVAASAGAVWADRRGHRALAALLLALTAMTRTVGVASIRRFATCV